MNPLSPLSLPFNNHILPIQTRKDNVNPKSSHLSFWIKTHLHPYIFDTGNIFGIRNNFLMKKRQGGILSRLLYELGKVIDVFAGLG